MCSLSKKLSHLHSLLMQAILADQSIGDFAISENVIFFLFIKDWTNWREGSFEQKKIKGWSFANVYWNVAKKLSLLLKKTSHNLPKQELVKIQKLGSENICMPFYFFKEFSWKFRINLCEMATKIICKLLKSTN